MGLELTLRAPSNATGLSYDFSFYAHGYPELVCTPFNDQFVAIVQPPPLGSINGNISFDFVGYPVSVNFALFDVCLGCVLGTSALVQTGFDTGPGDAGATGWLFSTASIAGGAELKVRFTIWDAGNADDDSTVIVDNFRWLTDDDSTRTSSALWLMMFSMWSSLRSR